MNDILLVGESGIDYFGQSYGKLLKKNTNSGKVTISFGGLMRNTAENLTRLGNKVILLTALGDDVYGNKLDEYMTSLGVKILTPKSNIATSSTVYAKDENGELDVAISDTRIMTSLSKEFIMSHKELFDSHEYIVIDANLSGDLIDFLFASFPDKKRICEAISPSKVLKFEDHLNKMHLLKCNIREAQALMKIDLTERDLVGGLLAKGIQNVVVSNRANDIYYGSDSRDIGQVHVEEIKSYISTNGCGDALFSGIIDKHLMRRPLKEAVTFGNKMSSLTLMSEKDTTEEISSLYYDHTLRKVDGTD
jgi:pseudouridine kinase